MWKTATEFIMLDRELVRQVFDLEWKYPIVKPSQQHNIWDLPHTAPGTHLSSSIEILIMHLWIQTLVSTWLQIHDHILLSIVIRAEFCSSFHDNLNQIMSVFFPSWISECEQSWFYTFISLRKDTLWEKNNFSMSLIFLFPRLFIHRHIPNWCNSMVQSKVLAFSPGAWQFPDVLPLRVGEIKTKYWGAALFSVGILNYACLPPCLGMGSVCPSSDDLASVNSVPQFEEVFQILVSLLKLFQTTSVRKNQMVDFFATVFLFLILFLVFWKAKKERETVKGKTAGQPSGFQHELS